MPLRCIDPNYAMPLEGLRIPPPSGEPCMMGWVEIAKLRINEAYQRDVDNRGKHLIRDIAMKFNWALFDVLVVSPIGGGLYAVVDGQHRTHGAAMAGISKVPCRIVPLDEKGQAAAFAKINGNVVAISSFAIFKAAIAANELWAVNAVRLAQEADCVAMTFNAATKDRKPGQIFSIELLREWAASRFEYGVKYLTALRLSKQGQTKAEVFSGRCLPSYLDAVHAYENSRKADVDEIVQCLNRNRDLHQLNLEARHAVAARKSAGVSTCNQKAQFFNDITDVLTTHFEGEL